MKIAVFGGSFDPPHLGHLKIVKEALKELEVDLVIVVPTYLNPFKKSFSAPPKLRLRWLRKVFLPYKKVKVIDFEVKQKRKVFTIQTLQYIKKRFAPKKIYLIIGADNLSTLPKWYKYKKLRKSVEIVVASRGERVKGKYKRLKVKVPISSTALRKKIQKRYLPKTVAKEIVNFYTHFR
ncbi:MAG: nicotinate (nicotinamide) nucleotide adenylyltransferase [Epsilonproteobacteria bacterium]|nr:nicotinate (nicotinamide) nucleotide adenylyltransferase [Campylobacterota bacterium]